MHESRVRIAGIVLILIVTACERKPDGTTPDTNRSGTTAPTPSTSPSPPASATEIIQKLRAHDDSHDSTMRMKAIINSQDDSVNGAPRQIQLQMYRKRESDGRLLILAEFTSPPEERDRDGLITVYADARIEAVRYVQSTDSFLVATDATSEDALFGLTPQEMADGQPEKYDFSFISEETYEGTPVYRLEGKLKPGAESKFPRLALLITKQDYTTREAEFYDNHAELARRLVVTGSQQIAGHWTRMRWSIDNLARRKKIEFEAIDVRYDQNLNDSIFTREHLKKIASR